MRSMPRENRPVIYEPEAEKLLRERLRALQAERLRSLVDYVKQRIPALP
jgi:phenylacetate-coenzyme A ligase PaaK-like adenylate-forming protein